MAAMAALQSSMPSLSLSISSNCFFGQRLLPPSHSTLPIKEQKNRVSLLQGLLKRWERKECKPNSLPVLQMMHVKVGDAVKVIAGDDKGKIGEVTQVLKHNSKVLVKDINLQTKHMKSKEEGEPGQILKMEAPIHSSNVMLYSKDQNVASRVGHKVLDNGQKVRYLIKTGEIIDSTENWKKLKEEESKKTEVAVASS